LSPRSLSSSSWGPSSPSWPANISLSFSVNAIPADSGSSPLRLGFPSLYPTPCPLPAKNRLKFKPQSPSMTSDPPQV
jgi:hypothetical protein